MDYARRRASLRETQPEANVSGFLVSCPENVQYLTGFTGGDSWLLLTGERTLLLTDFRYQEQAQKEAPDVEVVLRADETLAAVANRLLPPEGRIAFEGSHLSYTQYRRLADGAGADRLLTAEDWVEKLRAVKSPEEVALIRRAIVVAEAAFTETRAQLRPGMAEKEVADELVWRMRRLGAQAEAFPVIAAAGERGSLPHAQSTERRLRAGEAVLLDWGARVDFYNCDLTRVLFLGSIPGSIEEIYRVVLSAQQEAFEASAPGRVLGEIDEAARGFIARAGFGELFGHALGHGVGLEVHEKPTVRHNAKEVSQPGMVYTIEPGIYRPGVGGVRIEDMVLVGEAGAERMTGLSRAMEDMVV
jgi:Xaa-Pro aminopeptidase